MSLSLLFAKGNATKILEGCIPIREMKNETVALWTWHRNQDFYNLAGDQIYIVRQPDRCPVETKELNISENLLGPKPGLYPPEMPASGVELIGDGGGYITPGVDGVEAGVDIPPAVL
ncbi:Purple acid phosphatase 15 [Vitis vinifera]|uniref:Purple acid phosphatase 15 n=1 Tax=Vitis vinifera TaxID=29760 RepID=A0A438BP67_VITVI|nr:Purple acid phosphatase 15 [Vitis vinifera]